MFLHCMLVCNTRIDNLVMLSLEMKEEQGGEETQLRGRKKRKRGAQVKGQKNKRELRGYVSFV